MSRSRSAASRRARRMRSARREGTAATPSPARARCRPGWPRNDRWRRTGYTGCGRSSRRSPCESAWVRILELICTRVALPLGSTNSVKDTRASPSNRLVADRAAVRPEADRRDGVVGGDDAGVAGDRAQREVLAGESADQRHPGRDRRPRRSRSGRAAGAAAPRGAPAGRERQCQSHSHAQATACGGRSHGSCR